MSEVFILAGIKGAITKGAILQALMAGKITTGLIDSFEHYFSYLWQRAKIGRTFLAETRITGIDTEVHPMPLRVSNTFLFPAR